MSAVPPTARATANTFGRCDARRRPSHRILGIIMSPPSKRISAAFNAPPTTVISIGAFPLRGRMNPPIRLCARARAGRTPRRTRASRIPRGSFHDRSHSCLGEMRRRPKIPRIRSRDSADAGPLAVQVDRSQDRRRRSGLPDDHALKPRGWGDGPQKGESRTPTVQDTLDERPRMAPKRVTSTGNSCESFPVG